MQTSKKELLEAINLVKSNQRGIMPHTVEYNPEENMVIAKFMGKVDLPDLLEGLANIIRAAKQENCRYVLTDLHQADLQVSVSQTYNFPDTIKKIARAEDISLHQIKRAFVAAKHQDILEFYENVSINRSHKTKLFHDIEEAKSWLKEGRE